MLTDLIETPLWTEDCDMPVIPTAPSRHRAPAMGQQVIDPNSGRSS